MSVLGEILDAKRASLDELRKRVTRRLEDRGAARDRAPRSLELALARGLEAPLGLCCEHKRKSPSGGLFDATLSLSERVIAYANAGAKVVSVLTDGPYFGGDYDDLAIARETLETAHSPTLVLAKEFIIDPVQVRAARLFGADAVLLIVRIVDDVVLAELLHSAASEGLSALVEVTTERELDRALALGARCIGVNARDLDTLVLDHERAARVLGRIPVEVRAVHLSGLRSADDVVAVARGRADAALIGERLMREPSPAALLASFALAARTPRDD